MEDLKQQARSPVGIIATALVASALLLLLADLVFELTPTWTRLQIAITAVVLSVGLSAGLFVGLNYFFDLSRDRWTLFMALSMAVIGGLVFWVVAGNGLFGEHGLWTVLAIAVVGGSVVGGTGYVMAVASEPPRRLMTGAVGGAVLGVVAGLLLDDALLPSLDILSLVAWPLIGAAVGLALGRLRGSPNPVRTMVLLATLGWIIGAWLVPTYDGSRIEAIIGALGVGLGAGVFAGLSKDIEDASDRTIFADRTKIYLFLTPALFFIAFTLIIPLLRTIWLSFLGSETLFGKLSWVGLEQYGKIFTDPGIVNLDNWTGIFGSLLFQVGLVVAVIGIGVGIISGRRTGHGFDYSVSSLGSATLGAFLISWAVFAALRGTVFNNLWWVVTVTFLSTALGLAIAVLADRAKYESLAKSLIFMPMAISFVGAGIIWRFMFIARPAGDTQTGVMNAVWVWLGRVSNSGTGTTIAVVILLVAVAGLAYLAWRGLSAGANGVAIGSIVAALPLLFLAYRFLGPGLGGFVKEGGEIVDDTIIFLQESPYNNVWMMVVLIWIQTGFAMVIFSAAIKAVPAELIEASKVDGATESQTFWRVTIPQIATTIGVVTTTLIVTVLKVFDIVKVMTNGNFDTQVIANEMWQRAFTEGNFGLGSALAVVLFIAILPVMYLNIRRMQRAQAN
jgi:alpha-glucoside transport system permease protein